MRIPLGNGKADFLHLKRNDKGRNRAGTKAAPCCSTLTGGNALEAIVGINVEAENAGYFYGLVTAQGWPEFPTS